VIEKSCCRGHAIRAANIIDWCLELFECRQTDDEIKMAGGWVSKII